MTNPAGASQPDARTGAQASSVGDAGAATPAERIASFAYSAGWSAVRRLPEPAARKMFNTLADQVWTRRAGGVAQLEANLARVLGTDDLRAVRAVSRDGTRAYFQYWCDAFRLPSMSSAEVLARVTVDHFDRVYAARNEGRGVVLALPHMGNWDLVGAWLALTDGPFTTVAERLKPEELHSKFVAYREGLGMEVLPLSGEGQVFAALASRLRRGATVALLGDRDLTGSGVVVDLFGEAARLPAGPAALAASTGAALLPVTLVVDASFRLRGTVHPAIELDLELDRPTRLQDATQRLARVFERAIAAEPAQWHMMQRVWVSDLERAR